jgi:hypothetical protein
MRLCDIIEATALVPLVTGHLIREIDFSGLFDRHGEGAVTLLGGPPPAIQHIIKRTIFLRKWIDGVGTVTTATFHKRLRERFGIPMAIHNAGFPSTFVVDSWGIGGFRGVVDPRLSIRFCLWVGL